MPVIVCQAFKAQSGPQDISSSPQIIALKISNVDFPQSFADLKSVQTHEIGVTMTNSNMPPVFGDFKSQPTVITLSMSRQ
jgi:hypothetical protein